MSKNYNSFQNSDYLAKRQYKDSSNLDARAALHRQFSTAKIDWMVWVFDRLQLTPSSRVLECGCGPGWLWRSNVDRIPSDCHITLTDLSPGMVAEAEAALANTPHHFSFQPANIEALPFADDAFDVVVANHMLYHVPDLNQALVEIRRVLKGNGRFFAATNGNRHMKEISEFGQAIFPGEISALKDTRLKRDDSWFLSFRLENGGELLYPYFSRVDLRAYDDGLRVTEVQPLIAYIMSTVNIEKATEDIVLKLTNYLEQKLAVDGAIYISKESGLFIAGP